MDQGVNGAACVELEGQPFDQFGDQNGIVGYDGIVGQAHLGVFRFDLGDRYVGDFATGSACGRQDNQLFRFHDRNFPFKSVSYVGDILQDENFGDVDDRTAADGDHAVEVASPHVVQNAVHHLVRGFPQTVLLLHDEAAGQVQPFHERFI